MPLQPDLNTAYWPLLLTDPLYILQQDLVQHTQPQVRAAAGEKEAAQVSASASTPVSSATETVAHQADLLWGSLSRGILILVDYPDHTLMDRPDGLFLVEVLKALGLDFKEVATLNICRCKTAADWGYVQQLAPTSVISFGVQHAHLPYTQNGLLYEAKNEENKVFMLAEPLSVIRGDVSRKKRLWNLLRGAFVL